MSTSVTSPRFLQRIPIDPANPYPTGRHIEWDERSKRYAVRALPSAAWKDVSWDSYAPILDQQDLLSQGIHLDGNPDALNSCTGNAAAALAGTSPLYQRQPPSVRAVLKDAVRCEELAITLYAEATELDEFPETYPPTDDGSSGLGVMKALQKRGIITSYSSCYNLSQLITALQTGPVAVGTNWYESFFTPDANGFLTISPGSQVAGGHEYVLDAVWLKMQLFRMRNSWATSWGHQGCAFLSFATAERLIFGEQGDAYAPRMN